MLTNDERSVLPFDSSMAEPVPTRRSSRRATAASANPTGIETGSVDAPRAPLSRREMRELQHAAELAEQRTAAALAAQQAPVAPREPVSVVHDVAQTVVRAAEVAFEVAAQTAPAPARVEAVPATAALPALVDAGYEPMPVVSPEDYGSVLVEPALVRTAVAEDAFVAASRAFGTVEADTSIFSVANMPVAPEAPLDEEERPTTRVALRRRLLTLGATVGVMGVAGLLAVSMTLPAEAVAAAQGAQPASAMSLITNSDGTTSAMSEDEIQAFVASSDLQNDAIQRSEDFSSESLIDLAAEQGIAFSDDLYTNDPDAAIQWPFKVGVAMSSPYGARWGRMHEGIDLVPGDGAPIQAIADGTVRIATESGGNYGVTVYVDHIIDGQLVTSHYSHMQYGSLRVSAGQTVKVGDIVGLTGNTGRSYGSHLHFEIIINGSTIDPLPWMQKNAGRYDY